MRRNFDYEKGGLLLERKFFDDKKFDYEKEVVLWKRKFYDEKKV